MGRWTQCDEDPARLPEGMKRVGYDSDTRRYTFQDRTGVLYQSEPGNAYGTLTPVHEAMERSIQKARPNAFEPSDPAKKRRTPKGPTINSNLNSFEEFLPSEAITSPSSSPPKSSFTTSPTKRLPGVFFKVKAMSSTISRMQASTSEGSRHTKSPSLPAPSTSRHRSHSPPPLPTRQRRGYSQLPEPRLKEEDKRSLLRSKTVSSRTSTDSSGSRSSYQHLPNRSTSRASRVSTISTTSTITPMKTR